MRWRRALFLTVLSMLGLWHPGHAIAAPAGGWGAGDLRVAEHYWGTTSPPNCASETIHFGESPPEAAPRESAANIAERPGTACVMWIGPYTNSYEQCLVVVHEFGHWMGYGWGTDPKSITYDGQMPWNLAESGAKWEPPYISRCVGLERIWQPRA